MTRSIGGADRVLDESEVDAFVQEQLAGLDLDGRTLCIVIPDATRRCPLPAILGAIKRAVHRRVRACTAVVALGTHAPLSPEELRSLVGVSGLHVVNHAWWDETTFAHVGSLPSELVAELSGGALSESVDVRVNRLVVESDVTLIVGPVLPHEVVGFSGGEKYLFPGLSGPELIDLTHWLGAVITSAEIIGATGITPVRALIHTAAALVPGERYACCLVTDRTSGGVASLAFGDPVGSWAAAAAVAAASHVVYLDRPVRRVVSLVGRRYPDMWTGAKGFYKVEPVVADGGEVIVHAPHITQFAPTHPEIDDIGFHCRDYFLANWDRYAHHRRGVLAHSTHLFGAGTWSPVQGEQQRVRVTLATGIAADRVRRVNLHHVAPDSVDVLAAEDDPDTLVVHDAGEVLYRLRSGSG